jgi:hypothetical protein
MRQVPCEVQLSQSGRASSGFIGTILDQPFLKGKSAVLCGLLRPFRSTFPEFRKRGSVTQEAVISTFREFSKRRNVTKAIFGDKWKPGKGKDQIAAFRAIPRPFAGKIKTRKDAQIAIERAKVGRFKMLQKPEK